MQCVSYPYPNMAWEWTFWRAYTEHNSRGFQNAMHGGEGNHPDTCQMGSGETPIPTLHNKYLAILPTEGKEEVTQTIQELAKVVIVHPIHSAFNSLVWAVQKPDGTWGMTGLPGIE